MPQITITISTVNMQRFVDAAKFSRPIPNDEDGDPLYTDGAWARRRLKRMLAREVFIAEKNAEVSSVIQDDNIADVT